MMAVAAKPGEGRDDGWRLVIPPDRAGGPVAVVAVWAVCGLVAWLVSLAFPEGIPEWVAWALVAPYALVMTWFGLRTWLYGAGTITLSREGFSVSGGQRQRLDRRWDEVREFFIAKAFRSPVYQGRDAPHVRFMDGSVDWLPQNSRHGAGGIVVIMEGARRLAAAGWPFLPRNVEALGDWLENEAGERKSEG